MTDESALRYDRLVEQAGGLAESHTWLIERVPPGSLVLDCGCAGGYLAKPLQRRLSVVDGVDLDEKAAEQARPVYRRVYTGSIEDETFLHSLKERYDRIILGDVLEHTAQPERSLRHLRGLLAPGGRLLISMPNIAHWSIRWALLRGRFEYEDSGIMDRTHLRFFTYRTARDLAKEAGYRIVSADCTVRLHPALTHVHWLLRKFMRRFPNLLGYQTLLDLAPRSIEVRGRYDSAG